MSFRKYTTSFEALRCKTVVHQDDSSELTGIRMVGGYCSRRKSCFKKNFCHFMNPCLCFCVFQTFSGCSLTVFMMKTSSQRTLSTSGRRAKTLPSSRVRVWPSSLSRPSSPGCGRRRKSRKIINEGDTRRTQRRRSASLQQNKQTFKMGVWTGRHVLWLEFFSAVRF